MEYNILQEKKKKKKLLWIQVERPPILKRCIKVHNKKFVFCTVLSYGTIE